MMQDVYFGLQLPFESKVAQDHSEDVLMLFLGTNARLNLLYLLRNPETPLLYDAGVEYVPPDQTTAPPFDPEKTRELTALLRSMGVEPETALMVHRIVRGVEVFLDIPSLYERLRGDCNELVPVRLAELWRVGIRAAPHLTRERNSRGGMTYHVIVKWPDGSSEDPSLILGMGGQNRAADRREEIEKNKERFATWFAAGQALVSTGAPVAEVSRHIDLMGLLPRKGGFPARVRS